MKNSLKNLFRENRKAFIAIAIILLICAVIPFLIFNENTGASAAATATPAAPATTTFWLWNFLGRLHPLAVHFPVSLLLFAAILELFTLKNFNSKLRPGINLLVYLGTVAAIISVILGLLLANSGDYSGNLLPIHKWTGIATACLGIMAACFLFMIMNRNRNYVKVYRGIVFFTAVSLSVAGHFGASLTHGDDYLSSAIPWSKHYVAKPVITFDITAFKDDTAKLTPAQEKNINIQVRAILAHNCYKCHGTQKVKGGLRLDGKHMVFKGGEDGPVIIPGNPSESEIFRRISLPGDDEDVMPSKGKKLSEKEIALLGFWIKKGAPWPGDDSVNVFPVAKLEPRNPPLPATAKDFTNPVDVWVNDYFKKNKISWPAVVDDRTYLRRIYLDIIGLLPKPEELDSFINDSRSDKRALWVRKLLDRNDDYAMHWLTFWNDALRNDYTGTGYITGGRFNITDWLYNSLKSNKPYNQFVSELVSPTKESRGFIAGIKWRGVVNASQRTEIQAAQNISQVFLGLNLKCASCHNSFISDWKLDDAYAFANIFADTSMEINRCDKPTGKFAGTRVLWPQLGKIDSTAPTPEKLAQLAEALTKPEDGRLYRTLVNRIWAQMMGRGIIEPVDMMDNKPWSQDLLDWMAFNFVKENYDIKQLIYLIATSNTYQLPSVGFKRPDEIIAKDYQFRGMLRERMSAEQFTDAISSIIAPVFPDSLVKYYPLGKEVMGQPTEPFARASLVMNNSLLSALGRPSRETVATGRESQANLLQALELTNGQIFNSALKRGAKNWKEEYQKGDVIIKEIYKKALGREPQEKEFTLARQALGESPDTEAIQDLFWAVVLLPEFQIVY